MVAKMEISPLAESAATGSGGRPSRLRRDPVDDRLDRPDGRVHGSPPLVPSIAIRRRRLEEVLFDQPDQRVILVRGPAGAGKTVFVAQWAAAQADPCAWLSIDTTHNDPDRLRWHLLEAVERLSPDATGALLAWSPAEDRIDDTALRDLIDLVSHDLNMRLTLVFDDVHRLRDEAARHVISQLVEHPPDAARIVLISRSKPRLGLERARLRGDLVEVLPAMLRFERSEIDTLTATWTAWSGDVAELEQSTLGWAAGLRLAQLEAAADATSFTALGEPDGVASEYIREEFLDANLGDLQAFLDVTCWLPVLTEPLCVAAAAQSGRSLPLVWSDLEALPILPIASRPGSFRYPPILTRVMQQEYCRRDPDAARTARCHAAEACRRSGELVTSIELFLQAGCHDEAADVCVDVAEENEDSLRAVDELLHLVPDITSVGTRWLPWRIRAAVAAGHVDEASRLLEQTDRAVRSTDQPDEMMDPDLVIARAAVAERVGDVVALLDCADRLDALGEPGSGRHVPLAHGWRVRSLVWSGDMEGARGAVRAGESAGIGSWPEAGLDAALASAWVAWLDGDARGVSRIVADVHQDAYDSAERTPDLVLLAGSVHRERNQPAKALPLIQQAHSLAVAASYRVIEALAASELARSHLAAGRAMDALELVVSTRAAHPDLPSAIDAHLRHTEVRVRLHHGDIPGARVVLRQAPPGVETQLLAARVALHHAPDQARELLETTNARTPRQAVEKLLLHAQLPDVDPDDASAGLVAAISAGGHLGLVRTFLDEGPSVSRRLQQLALESPDRTLGRLATLVSQELAQAPTRESSELVEQLTPRELAVLRMLPLRMSNREMADQMYISVNTLKTHVRAIYRKLDVPHRSAAVRRAKALQLV
jgi:LuxR family maltose regulon positive regulatory protein